MKTETPTNQKANGKFIRLPNELAEQVKALAQQEDRYTSNMAQVLIREALQARANKGVM